MAIKSDRWIRRMAQEHGMINPFNDRQVREGVISYGVSSYGYDLRVADEFKIFTNVNSAIVDPKNFDERSFVSVQAPSVLIPPNSFALARSVEYFKIPRDVLTICVGKSTYARCGIIVNVTPFEPEWEGFVTLEISNSTPLPDPLLPGRRALRRQLQGQSREVPEAVGNRAAEAVRRRSPESHVITFISVLRRSAAILLVFSVPPCLRGEDSRSRLRLRVLLLQQSHPPRALCHAGLNIHTGIELACFFPQRQRFLCYAGCLFQQSHAANRVRQIEWRSLFVCAVDRQRLVIARLGLLEPSGILMDVTDVAHGMRQLE
jgi:dCTP deaminase